MNGTTAGTFHLSGGVGLSGPTSHGPNSYRPQQVTMYDLSVENGPAGLVLRRYSRKTTATADALRPGLLRALARDDTFASRLGFGARCGRLL